MHMTKVIMFAIGVGVLTTYLFSWVCNYPIYPPPRAAKIPYYAFLVTPGIAAGMVAQYLASL